MHQDDCGHVADPENCHMSTAVADASSMALVPFGDSPSSGALTVEEHTYRGVRVASSAFRRAAKNSNRASCKRSVQASAAAESLCTNDLNQASQNILTGCGYECPRRSYAWCARSTPSGGPASPLQLPWSPAGVRRAPPVSRAAPLLQQLQARVAERKRQQLQQPTSLRPASLAPLTAGPFFWSLPILVSSSTTWRT